MCFGRSTTRPSSAGGIEIVEDCLQTEAVRITSKLNDAQNNKSNCPRSRHCLIVSYMKPYFAERVCAIDWTAYETAYGRADSVPQQIISLASNDHGIVMDATHKLWCGLCHQHAYLSSAALVAYPFLLEVLDSADERLSIELLDIFTGFAFRSTLGPDGPSPNEWERELRRRMIEELPRFIALSRHDNEEIADFSGSIVTNLTTYPA